MNRYLPVALDLDSKHIVLIGAGRVALHKLVTLTQFCQSITVIAKEVLPEIRAMDVSIIEREYKSTDLANAFIVYAATNDSKINEQIQKDAHEKNVLINVVDNSSLSDFISPAVFKTKEAIISVNSDGKEPVLSRDLKNYIKEHWNDFLSYRNRP
jgi:siroheme synthase-like protein